MKTLLIVIAAGLVLSGCAVTLPPITQLPAPSGSVQVTPTGQVQAQANVQWQQLLYNLQAETYIEYQSTHGSWLRVWGQNLEAWGGGLGLRLHATGVVTKAHFVYDGRQYDLWPTNWQTTVPNLGDGGRHRLELYVEYQNDGQLPEARGTLPFKPFYVINHRLQY